MPEYLSAVICQLLLNFRSAVEYLVDKLDVGLTQMEVSRIFAGSVTNDFSHSHSSGSEVNIRLLGTIDLDSP